MNTIGVQRVIVIFILAAFAAGTAFLYYAQLLPQKENVERELRSANAQVSSMRGKLQEIREEFASFEQSEQQFKKLEETGFFNDQNRVFARERIESLQTQSRVKSVQYQVSRADIQESEDADRAGYALLSSPIRIELEAFNDMDIFRFIDLFQKNFPGHIMLNGIDLKKERNVNEATLRAIGVGDDVTMVSAQINAEWWSMAPQDNLEIRSLTQGASGQ